MSVGVIDILVRPDVREFAGGLRSGLQPAIGVAGALGSAIGLAIGGAAAFGQVIKIGNDFTTSLNTMKAVAGATADQMAQVSERAKQLGNDITLPGTSASDAAAAMTELAKGGFDVRQSMDAAKGSLQLAAAAQIDAAKAAGIQSQALQAFGLDATQAGRVADVLANTANASSAELTDVAYGLQAAGAVAHQFGLSIEDTAAAIGMFANSGIQGSDAGTLLKSALLALTDGGKPAQEAIKNLGLTVYDNQGRFAGMRVLFDELKKASERMTPEMYQAATATLFGSDAMRLAGIAAEKGVLGWDKMHGAMSRQGSAAEVAAAKMAGLPGAMQMVTNAAETLALGIYDLIKGPMESLAKDGASAITSATPALVAGLHSTADAAVDIGRTLAPVVSVLADLPGPIYAATAAFVLMRTTGIGAAMSAAAATTVSAIGSVASATTAIATANNRVIQTSTMGAVAMGRFGSAIGQLGTHVPTVAAMQTSYMNAATSATNFARTQGTVAAAATGVRSAVGGVVSMLGGPWMVGMAAAAAVAYQLWSEAKKSEENIKAMRESLRQLGATRSELSELFSLSGGVFNAEAINNVTAQVDIMKKSLDRAAENRAGFLEKGWEAPWSDKTDNQDWLADRWQGAKKIIDDLKMSDRQLAETLADNAKFTDLAAKLNAMGQDGRFAVSELQALRDGIVQTQAIAKNTTPGFATLSQAVKVLSDNSSSAADRINAMKAALDILSGKPVAAQDALAKYNAVARDTATTTQEAWDKTQGFGDALIGQGGAVNTASANGGRLYDALVKIKDATITAAEAGAQMGPVLANNETQFAQLATATGLTVDQVRAMATQMGYLPRDIEILASLKGADSTEQQLVVIQGLLRANRDGVEIPVTALTEEAKRALADADAKIDAVNGKPGIVKITAPDLAAVLAEMDRLINKNLPDKNQKVKVTYEEATASGEWRAPMVLPRADGGIDGALPSQAMIQSPRSRLYQWAEPETKGEAFIPLAESKRSRSTEILSTVAKMFGLQVTPMADGGITTQAVLSKLSAESGKPYQYAGVGNPSWDCSAFISAAYALLKGLDMYTRWFTTESDFPALGFKTGQDPTGRGLSVGIYRGGGGQYSHMAGTLAGVNLESGGNGVRVGSGALGAADASLPLKFYYPVSSSRTRSGSRSSKAQEEWTVDDDLELESAQISARQARERADQTAADAKKTPDEKRQAEIDAQQAQNRYQKMVDRRDQAKTSGGEIPEAPALSTNATDDEIRLEELQDAIEDARYDRNEVYDDPEATDADKRAADRAYQKAINALAAEQKSQKEDTSSSDSSTTLIGIAGDFAKTFVEGQLTDISNVIGLSGGPSGAIGNGIVAAINYKNELDEQNASTATSAAPVISQDDLAKQGPVVPGSDGWLEKLKETLLIPAVIRDNGGPLPHGTAAINTSGEEEWVLTGQQRRDLAASRQPMAPTTVDNSTTIQNLNTGMSQGEFARAWKMIQLDQQHRAGGLVRR